MKTEMPHLDVKKLKVGVNVLKSGVYVYKKLKGAICQMYLPEGTRIVKTKYETKYRADQAIVIMIVPFLGTYFSNRRFVEYLDLQRKTYASLLSYGIKYRMGKKVKPQYELNTNEYVDCASGIYFWETLKKAEDY